MSEGRIEAIYIAAQEGELPHEVESVTAVAGKGLEGNRYFGRRNPAQQLTLIEAEQLEGTEVDAAITGRNLLTRGIGLNDLVGKRFKIGDVECRGVELCEPCTTFESRTYPGAIKDFVHRTGLNAEILTGGELRPGDAISPLAS